eukprot:17736-Heterococcus_DN1.PRE.2
MSTVTARSSANGHQTNGAPTHTNGVDKVVPSKDSRMSKDELKLMVAVLGIYGCYLTSGILQEHIYSYRTASGERFGQTLFLLWVQCVVNVLFAGIAMVIGKLNMQDLLDLDSACHHSKFAPCICVTPFVAMLSRVNNTACAPVYLLQSAYRTDDVVLLLLAMLCAGGKSGEIIPHKLFAMAGTGYISAMVCSIEALKYVNFPTKELGKSCKMIPVMLFGVLFAGKRYSVRDYICVALITAGIVTFNLGGEHKQVHIMLHTDASASTCTATLTLESMLTATHCQLHTGQGEQHIRTSTALFWLLMQHRKFHHTAAQAPQCSFFRVTQVAHTASDIIKRAHKHTVHEMMFWMNVWALIVLSIGAAYTGEGVAGYAFCMENKLVL